jgi:class 3 adenylate cyclase
MSPAPPTPPPTAEAVLEQLGQEGAPVLHLLALCRTPDYLHVWAQGPELPRRFAKLLLKQGHPTFALEVASRCLEQHAYPGDPELLFYRALALANSGNLTRAGHLVRDLLRRDGLPVDVRGRGLDLAGRIGKDLAARAHDEVDRDANLRKALWCYRQAYGLNGDPFPGINAATLARLCGDRGLSRDLAGQVKDKVLARLDAPGADKDYWLLAQLAEAYLLLGDGDAATGRYAQAVRLAGAARNHGDVASMLRQLRLLQRLLPAGELPISEGLLGLFRLGPVVVFAGHNLDRPGEPPRFPADAGLEAAVRRAIKHELDALGPAIGYCIPGCGSEILFGELMHQRDAELHVVLPYAEEDFLLERVTYGLPGLGGWRRRYQELLGVLRLTRHFATTEEYLGARVLNDFASEFMQGLALMRAAQVIGEAVALVVQDSASPATHKGTAAFIKGWKERTGQKARVIDLAEVRAKAPVPSLAGDGEAAPERPRPQVPERTVKAMLFADVAGFSGLPEAHLPAFFLEFLGLVSKELKATPALSQNTWGDGLYLVFEDVARCAAFAMRLLERCERFDFPSFGFALSEERRPGVRIGLHVGPVYEGVDPIIDRKNYFGNHVSRAARIEPVTAVGCAYASEQFAALLAGTPGHEYACEYLGLQPLAKDYDVTPLYRLAGKGPG